MNFEKEHILRNLRGGGLIERGLFKKYVFRGLIRYRGLKREGDLTELRYMYITEVMHVLMCIGSAFEL